ncbi:MAG: pilus assembly PilX N-terminal domain-containing protein, partial [Minisyncoccia bacterium]
MNSKNQNARIADQRHVIANSTRTERGVTIILVVAFMAIFTMILGAITSYTFTQARYGRALYAREQAIQIAEAGIEYYRWFLAHNPYDLTNGTGGAGPYTYTVPD